MKEFQFKWRALWLHIGYKAATVLGKPQWRQNVTEGLTILNTTRRVQRERNMNRMLFD